MSNGINVYGCGGAAVKITRSLHLSIDLASPEIIPELNYLYLDTSATEQSIIEDKNIFHVLDTENGSSGSGGVRGANYSNISDQVPIVMREKLPAAKINFVIFHSGGGSGSTIGFTIINDLIKRGIIPIVFLTNTPNSLHRCNNATKTMTSLDTVAKRAGVVLPAFISDTTEFDSYSDCNFETIKNILMTAAMLSEDVISMDDADRSNFINPMNMPDHTVYPGLHEMHIVTGKFEKPNDNIVSILTLVPDGNDDEVGSGAEFIFSGVLTDGINNSFHKDPVDSVSLYTETDTVSRTSAKIVKKLDSLKDSKEQIRKESVCKVSSKLKQEADDNGFIV